MKKFVLTPYETTYGKMINTTNLQKELFRYYAENYDKALGYEYNTSSPVELMFVVGYTEEERKLPVWNHPFVFTSHKGVSVVAVDLRQYASKTNEQPMNIRDIVRDTSGVTYLTTAALTTATFLNGDYGTFRSVFKSIMTGYAMAIGTVVSLIVSLNPVEKGHVELAAAHFTQLLFTDSKDLDSMYDTFVARLDGLKLSIPFSKKVIAEKLRLFDTTNRTIEGLVANIQSILPDEKARLIDVDVLTTVYSSIWHGPGSSETAVISIEFMPVWIAMMYATLNSKVYKKSRLGTMLDKYSRNIKSTDFEKQMTLYVKERTIFV